MSEENKTVEIVPGESIGDLRLGTPVGSLPTRAVVQQERGQMDGFHFTLENDRVSDIWIEDIRTYTGTLIFRGRVIPPKVSLAEIQQIFDGCVAVEGIKGGRFFNCNAGVALGSDFDGSERFVQLRIKHR